MEAFHKREKTHDPISPLEFNGYVAYVNQGAFLSRMSKVVRDSLVNLEGDHYAQASEHNCPPYGRAGLP
jgi:hypothetical protein